GKAGHGAVGVVGDAAGVGGPAAADRGRLAQRIQGAGDRVPAGIGQDVLMPVGVVLVGHREGVPGRYRDQLGQDHAALEVGVEVARFLGIGALGADVPGADLLRLAVGVVAPGLVAVAGPGGSEGE